jgi:hypothetical protein
MPSHTLPELVFDASSLITATRFEVKGRPILDYILNKYHVVIPEAVKVEVVDEGLRGGYPDAVILNERVNAAKITVLAAVAHPDLEVVLTDYGLEKGDRALLQICRARDKHLWAVTDDRLLYIVLNRFGLRPCFLPDVLEWLVAEKIWTLALGETALQAIQSRYRLGFIRHSLERMNGRL